MTVEDLLEVGRQRVREMDLIDKKARRLPNGCEMPSMQVKTIRFAIEAGLKCNRAKGGDGEMCLAEAVAMCEHLEAILQKCGV